jgi:glycosyltransferase involved in cell wall biosynthesis
MKIVQIILSRGFAGSERYAADLCNSLSARHEVVIVIQSDHRDDNGVSIRDWLAPTVKVIEIGKWFQGLRLASILRRVRPDVIHAHLKYASRLAPTVAMGTPTISTLHLEYKHKHFRKLDAVICITDGQRSTIPPEFAGSVFVIPNSYLPHRRLSEDERSKLREQFGIDSESLVFGSVSRLHRLKGVDVIIEAFNQAAIDKAMLLIVGDGEERSNLQRWQSDRIRFLGFRSDVGDLFASFDVFVSAARLESFGLVLLEAMDAGLPVIATRTQGALEVLAGTSARLVPIDNVSALAEALRHEAEAGRHRVDYDLTRFDHTVWVNRIEEVYRDLAASSGTIRR